MTYDDATGSTHTLTREVVRPYPAVPRTGEAIFLGEVQPDGRYLPPRRVEDVIYENDGRITLTFSFDGLSNDPGPQVEALRAEGFR